MVSPVNPLPERHRKGKILSWFLCCQVSLFLCFVAIADEFTRQRETMVREIEAQVEQTGIYLRTDQLDAPVISAMRKVPRHEFVPAEQRDSAYANRPLPIGHGQTISQPYIVAIMTHLLQLAPGARVFELGTGSGYQAAVLAELAGDIHTIEIIPELADQARIRFKRLGYARIRTRQGDGYFGWPEAGPFDGIIVTAAADHVPPPLVRQLRDGGRMVIPVGHRFGVQQLLLITKGPGGELQTRQILPVRFVPLTGKH